MSFLWSTTEFSRFVAHTKSSLSNTFVNYNKFGCCRQIKAEKPSAEELSLLVFSLVKTLGITVIMLNFAVTTETTIKIHHRQHSIRGRWRPCFNVFSVTSFHVASIEVHCFVFFFSIRNFLLFITWPAERMSRRIMKTENNERNKKCWQWRDNFRRVRISCQRKGRRKKMLERQWCQVEN